MYNITGWSGGGRRPLSYNLMPGQFRNTRVNVFSNPTIINNNIGGFGGCYDYGDCGCGGSNKMSWMDWTMMGGMLLNGLGNMFACFWGGGGGGTDKAKADAPDDKSLQTKAKSLAEFYSDDTHKIKVHVDDGTITVKINGKVVDSFNDYDKFKEFLEAGDFDPDDNDSGAPATPATATPATATPATAAPATAAPTGLGTDWNGVKFGGDDGLQITKIIDAALGGNTEITIKSVTYGTVQEGTGIPKTITVKDANGGEYEFKLVENYTDYLTNGNGNIRYACVKTPGGALAADKQQQFDLNPNGTFTQEGMTKWQGSEHKLDFTIASGTHKGEGYRENTYSGTTSTVFPSTEYTHVRVPRNSKQANNFQTGMTLDQVLKACGITNPTKEMREAFLKMNQDAFDMSGILVDPKDLDVFIANSQKSTWGLS